MASGYGITLEMLYRLAKSERCINFKTSINRTDYFNCPYNKEIETSMEYTKVK
jgi:hypothetical protein